MNEPHTQPGQGIVVGVPQAGDRTYDVDVLGFLVDAGDWTEDFAEVTARVEAIPGGLTAQHWAVIRFVRQFFVAHGVAPAVAQPCRGLGLGYADLMSLFPTGYRHGVLKLAGLPEGARLGKS